MPVDFWRWEDSPAAAHETDSIIFARQVLARSGLAGTGLAGPPAPPVPVGGMDAAPSPTPPSPVPFAGVGVQPSPTPAPTPLPQTPAPPPGLIQPLAAAPPPEAPLTSVEAPPAPPPRQLMADAGVAGTPAAATGGGDIEAYVRERAAAHGISPDTAVAVANSEGGLQSWNKQSDYINPTTGQREESYSPFQLYLGGGLGNAFMAETGLDPRLAENGPAAVDWALGYAAQHGWGSWNGAKALGMGMWDGIGQAAQGAASGLSDIGHTIGGAVTGAADTALGYGQQAARTAGGLVGGAADTAGQAAGGALGIGKRFLGVPYEFGAAAGQTAAFDCSSFVQYVYGQLNMALPRVAFDQWRATADGAVDLKDARPGDLIFFKNTYAAGNPENISHVAIYAGNGEFLGAQGDDVNIGHLDSPYWQSRFAGVHHVGDAAASGAATTTLGLVGDSPNPVVPATRKVTGETAGPAERSYSEQWTDRILGDVTGAVSGLAGSAEQAAAPVVQQAAGAVSRFGSGLAETAGQLPQSVLDASRARLAQDQAALAQNPINAQYRQNVTQAGGTPGDVVSTATAHSPNSLVGRVDQALQATGAPPMTEQQKTTLDYALQTLPIGEADIRTGNLLRGLGPNVAERVVGTHPDLVARAVELPVVHPQAVLPPEAQVATYARAVQATGSDAARETLRALRQELAQGRLGEVKAAQLWQTLRADVGQAAADTALPMEGRPRPAPAQAAVPAAVESAAAPSAATPHRGPPAGQGGQWVDAEGQSWWRGYHGTGTGFQHPDPDRFDPGGLFGPAYYLTDSAAVASRPPASLAGTVADTSKVGYAWQRSAAAKAEDTAARARAALDTVAADHPHATPAERLRIRTGRERALAAAEAEAAAQRATQTSGPNVRVVDVPHTTRLFDADATTDPALVERLRAQLGGDAPETSWTLGTFDDAYDHTIDPTNTEVYRALVRAMEGDKAEANATLQAVGFDGVRYNGGVRVPMLDAAGAPIEHTAVALFPAALPQVRNATSGLMLGARGGGFIAGGVAGAALPADTPEERWQHALIGALALGGLEVGGGALVRRGLARPAAIARFGDPPLDAMAKAFAEQRPSGFLVRMRQNLPAAPAWLRRKFVTDANYADQLTKQARVAAGQTNERLTPAAIDAEARYSAWQGRHVAGENFTKTGLDGTGGLEPVFRLLTTPREREAFSILRELQRVIETADIRIGRGANPADIKFPFGISSLAKARDSLRQLELHVGPDVWARLQQADRVLQNHLNTLLDMKVQKGIVPAATQAALLAEHPHFSPQVLADAEQVFKGGGGGGRAGSLDNLSNGLRRLSALGHVDETLDPLVATIALSLREYDRIMRNDTALAIVDANRALFPNDTKLVSQWVPNQAIPLDPAQVQAIGKGPFKALTPREHAITPKGIWVSRNGKSQLWSAPKDAIDFAHGMDHSPVIYDGWNRVSKILNDFQRGVFTERNAVFPILNGGADAGIAGMSGVGPRALAESYRGAFAHEFGGHDPVMRRFLLGGGGMGGFSGGGEQGARKLLSQLEAAGQSRGALQKLVQGAWDTASFKFVGKYGRPIENAPRRAAFLREEAYQAQHGVSNPARAVMAGRRVTIDFSRAGSWVRHANAVTLFLNAGLQGLYRIGGLLANPATRGTAKKFVAGLEAATLAAYAMNRQYVKSDGTLYLDDIPDYIKDTSQVLMIPGTETVDDQGHESMKWIAIPTRQLGLFTNPVQRGLRQLDAEHPDQLEAGVASIFGPSFAAERRRPVAQTWPQAIGGIGSAEARLLSPFQGGEGAGAFVSSVVPSTVGTLAEAQANYDYYRGFPIVPPHLADRLPEWQYDAQTTPVASTISAGVRGLPFGLADLPVLKQAQSPKLTDFMLQGIGGGPAALYGGLVDVGLGEPEKGLEQVRQATIGRIIRDRSGQANRDVTGAFLEDARQRELASVEELRNSALWASATPEEQQSLVAGLHARAQSAALRELPPNAIPDYLKERVAGTPTQPGEPPKYVARRLPADVRSYYDGRYGLMAEDMSRAADYIQMWKRNRRLMAPPSPWQRRLALLANRTNPAWERWNVRQGRLGRDVRQSTLDYAVAQAG